MTNLQEAVESIMKFGPRRVVINAEGEATSSRRARVDHGVMPDVIFIRSDGWTLGAPKELISLANRMWRDEWIGVLVRPSSEAMTYEDWQGRVGASGYVVCQTCGAVAWGNAGCPTCRSHWDWRKP